MYKPYKQKVDFYRLSKKPNFIIIRFKFGCKLVTITIIVLKYFIYII